MHPKLSRFANFIIVLVAIGFVAGSPTPSFAQVDIKAVVVKHLKTSRDFTLKVADQMPESTYDFKLTPPQMSFAEQMIHLSQEQAGLLAIFSGAAPKAAAKPATMSKKDV